MTPEMYSTKITIKTRDKLREEFSKIQASIYTNEALFSMGFDGGFDACYKLMQEREKVLVEALEKYANGEGIQIIPEKRHLYLGCKSISSELWRQRSMSDYDDTLTAKEALSKIRGEM